MCFLQYLLHKSVLPNIIRDAFYRFISPWDIPDYLWLLISLFLMVSSVICFENVYFHSWLMYHSSLSLVRCYKTYSHVIDSCAVIT